MPSDRTNFLRPNELPSPNAMSSRRLRSAPPLDQQSTTPRTRRSGRISQGNASQSAQSSSRQEATDSNTRSQSGKEKRKQPADCSKPPSSKRTTTRSAVLAASPSEQRSNDHTSSNPQPKYFRISGVPSTWNEDDLFGALLTIVPSLTRQYYRPSLYPACSRSTQTAVLNLGPFTAHLQQQNHLEVSDPPSKTYLQIDSDFYNLTPLNVPIGEVVADVIAVTGLAGHAYGSWRSGKSDQMWLRDLLPQDIQNIRIMSYGYDSRLTGQGKAENRLLDYQRFFIQDIENARGSVKKTRPIIFIGHSLGGILILQALIECKRNRTHTHILDAMHSIIFFGTPHQGMRTYDLEEMVDAESGGYDTSRGNLLKQLREGSEFLENQKDDLSYIWEECKPKILSFYELAPTSTVELSDSGSYESGGKESKIVKRFSAKLYIPNEQRVPVKENHTNMVKFASVNDPTYETVVRCLKEWVDSIESDAAEIRIQNFRKSKEYADCRKSLKPSDYESYREEIWNRRHENTCTWILSDQRYQMWTEKNGQAILWISGGPGFGKSVLSSFLTKEITRGKTNQLYMAYFFCDDKDERLRTAHAILVNLLTQLLDQVPDVIDHFLAEPEYITNKEKTSWSFGMLWRVFERITKDTNRGQVYILIDALDECEEISCTKLLKQLQLLLCEATTATRPINIIITSRPHIPITSYLKEVIEMPLAADNLKSDITAFVEAEVHQHPQFRGSLGEEVRKALIDGANGMFLWVSLILKDLKASMKTTRRAIRNALQTLPSDLPGELTIAIAILPEHTSMFSMKDDMETNLRQVLRFIFGPMLRIENDETVHLVHQSAKDFLSGTNIATEGALSLPAWVTASAKSNLQLAVSCLAYLSFDECEDGPVVGEYVWQDNIRKAVEILQHNLPLLDYAATHWPEHARQAYQGDEHQILFLAFQKLAESTQKMNLGYQIYTFSRGAIFKITAPLQIAASLGLIAFVKQLLNHGTDINAQGGRYGNALRAAAAEGHVDMVRLLSTRADIQINEPIIMDGAENRSKGKEVMEITEPIVTAAAGNWDSGKAVMEVLLSARPDIHISEPIVRAAAGNLRSGKAVMELLLSARPDIQITEPIVTAAAGNWDCGKAVMEVLLSARPDIQITEPMVTAAAGNWRSSKAVMEVLLSARPDIQITEPIVTAAAGKSESGKAVMEVLLSARPDIEITEPIVTAAAGNSDSGKAVMEVLLSARPEIQITEMAVVAMTTTFDKEVIKRLLAARPDIQITEPIVTATAGNWRSGKAVMEVLLSARPDIQITEPIVTAAAGNSDSGKAVMEVLLSARPNIQITEMAVVAMTTTFDKEVIKWLLSARPDIQITEPIVTAAARNWRSGKAVMEVLLSARPDIEITEPIVTAAAGNSDSGKAVMEVLLSARPDIQITEPIVTAAAENSDSGKAVMKVLLSARPDIQITEPIVTAAAGNLVSGKAVMEVLLSARPDIQITEPILTAAAGNWDCGKAVMEVLLFARPDIQITEPIVTTAAGNWHCGKAVMEVLLSARPDIQITEPIVTAAAGNWHCGKAVMEVLLSARPDIQITEPIVTAAAGNWDCGKAVMEVLLSARPEIQITEMAVVAMTTTFDKEVIKWLLSASPDIQITEPIVTATAGNWRSGKAVMEVLLSARPDIQITEPIVTAAAGNSRSGKAVMEVLLSARPDIRITEMAVVAMTTTFDKEVIQRLLSARPDIQITEPIVTAAAGNRYSGKAVMEVLLSARPDIQITEPIVTAAAGNGRSGKAVMEVLLSARPDIQITEPIVTAAAGNSDSGKVVMEVLLSARPDIQITEPIVTAAAGNPYNGKQVMLLLLDNQRQYGVHPASVKAAAYFGMHDYAKRLLTKCSQTLNEKYTQHVHAAVESGVADMLKEFLELGDNNLSPDEHNWTPYMTACQSWNTFALQQFANQVHPTFSSVFPCSKWVSEQACVSIQLQEDGTGLLYSGTSTNTRCSVKGDHPFPPGSLGTNYFEVSVIESSSELNMSVGFCGQHILQNNIPQSYCFASAYFSDGTCSQGTKPPYKVVDCGPTYSSGHVIGCGIDWKTESYFFTLNGQTYKTLKNGELLRRRLYPLVTFAGKFNVSIQANFRGPFVYTLSQEEQGCGGVEQLK
ncbi:hypothetical protein BDD12DRAFT_895913 [Trichophaea hybrida]|nr:hypothetical protein BDD12DRAFT_895913 [Trichophaea hybrida]